MPGLTIDQILTAISADEWRSKAYTILQGLGLQPQLWPKRSIGSTIWAVASQLLELLSGELSSGIAQQWNPTAVGGGLQLLSKYFYEVEPPQPSFASGQLTLTNTGGGVYTYAAGGATFESTIANAQGVYPTYTNDAGFTLTAVSALTLDVTCTFAGSGGNAPIGAVSGLVTAMLGVTATNAAPILGADALPDDQLRQLNLDSLGARSSFGPRSAYSYAIATATNAVTGSPVNINRKSIAPADHTGNIAIYICGPTGTTDSNDLIGVAQCIEDGTGSTDANFHGARPDNVTVGPGTVTLSSGQVIGSPLPALPVPYTVAIVVYVACPKGTAQSTVAAAITTALDTFFASEANPIGGLPAVDDSGPMTGIFESGISGVIAVAVASLPGCQVLSTRFSGVSDLPLIVPQVATNGITSIVVNLQYVTS